MIVFIIIIITLNPKPFTLNFPKALALNPSLKRDHSQEAVLMMRADLTRRSNLKVRTLEAWFRV